MPLFATTSMLHREACTTNMDVYDVRAAPYVQALLHPGLYLGFGRPTKSMHGAAPVDQQQQVTTHHILMHAGT